MFDPVGRLTAKFHPEHSRATFAYDAVNNRPVKNDAGALTTSPNDAANQIQTAVDQTCTTTFTFYAAGNHQLDQAPRRGRVTE